MKLQLRVGDVEFWKGELDNKLAQLKEEIEEAVSIKMLHCSKNQWEKSSTRMLYFLDVILINILGDKTAHSVAGQAR